jgi:hypothetical protein
LHKKIKRLSFFKRKKRKKFFTALQSFAGCF